MSGTIYDTSRDARRNSYVENPIFLSGTNIFKQAHTRLSLREVT